MVLATEERVSLFYFPRGLKLGHLHGMYAALYFGRSISWISACFLIDFAWLLRMFSVICILTLGGSFHDYIMVRDCVLN